VLCWGVQLHHADKFEGVPSGLFWDLRYATESPATVPAVSLFCRHSKEAPCTLVPHTSIVPALLTIWMCHAH